MRSDTSACAPGRLWGDRLGKNTYMAQFTNRVAPGKTFLTWPTPDIRTQTRQAQRHKHRSQSKHARHIDETAMRQGKAPPNCVRTYPMPPSNPSGNTSNLTNKTSRNNKPSIRCTIYVGPDAHTRGTNYLLATETPMQIPKGL